MNDERIRVFASRKNVPIGTIEKDYAVTGVLSLIAQLSKLDKMVFKGGTAIKKSILATLDSRKTWILPVQKTFQMTCWDYLMLKNTN